MKAKFLQHEIVTLAVYLQGGATRHVDIEDVAVKANEIAPGRFTWRKYPEQIDIDTVWKNLYNAMKHGGYVIGSERAGWLLTEKGLRFASERIGDLEGADLSRTPVSREEERWRKNAKKRMLADAAFLKFQSNGIDTVSSQEAEAFFRVDDYVVGTARQEKVFRILNAFGEDLELGPAVKALAGKVRGR